MFLLVNNLYPYVFLTIILSPLLIIVGIIGWVKNYKIINNRLPNPFSSLAKSMAEYNILLSLPFGIMHFIFTHIVHWFIFCTMIMMIMMAIIEPLFKRSKTFEIAKRYVESDSTLIKSGKIKYYGLFPSGTIKSNGDGKINFIIIGEHNIIKAEAKVENNRVTEIQYK